MQIIVFASKKLDGENYDTEHVCFCEYKRYMDFEHP